MNKYVEGFGDSAPSDIVVLFDAKAGWNQAGGPELLRTDNHGGEGCNVLFVDSHTEFIKTENLGELKWKP
jgi:prepilin-type processing-associated H-X9-DG protein